MDNEESNEVELECDFEEIFYELFYKRSLGFFPCAAAMPCFCRRNGLCTDKSDRGECTGPDPGHRRLNTRLDQPADSGSQF
jgi:hypothetical protein